jgi:hypothetical protein
MKNKHIWESGNNLAQQKVIMHAIINARNAYRKSININNTETKSLSWAQKLKKIILGPKFT